MAVATVDCWLCGCSISYVGGLFLSECACLLDGDADDHYLVGGAAAPVLPVTIGEATERLPQFPRPDDAFRDALEVAQRPPKQRRRSYAPGKLAIGAGGGRRATTV